MRPTTSLIKIILFTCLSATGGILCAQEKGVNSFIYPDIDEGKLFETQWKYVKTLHQRTQQPIHRAVNGYENYLYFKLDKTCSIFQNGQFLEVNWKLQGPKLFFSFRGIDSFLIVKLDENHMVLEYNTSGSGESYEYHFETTDKTRIFKRSDNLLPEVPINTNKPGEVTEKNNNLLKKFWYWLFGEPKEEKPPGIYINIEIIGGGFYGGIDPPVKNYIQLRTDGKLIREYETIYNGMVKSQKSISRAELEEFAHFIDKKGFFSLPGTIECNSPDCFKRLNKKPVPIPYRISVTYGLKHKVISVPIYGKDEKGLYYLSYPVILDQITDILNRMANRLD